MATVAPTYVNDLDIPMRVKNALADNGFALVEKVIKATDGQLCRIPNLGRKGVQDLRHAISIFDPAPAPPKLGLKVIQDAVWIAADIRGICLTDIDTETIAFAAVEALRDYTEGMPRFMEHLWQERMDKMLKGAEPSTASARPSPQAALPAQPMSPHPVPPSSGTAQKASGSSHGDI